MRAKDNVHSAIRQVGHDALLLSLSAEARQQSHAHRVIGRPFCACSPLTAAWLAVVRVPV